MLSKILKTGATVALALSLTACATSTKNNGAGTNGAGNNGAGNNGVTTQGINGQGRMLNNGTNNNNRNNNVSSMHNNSRVDMDERIANAVAQMPDVDSATVMITNKNAYVAVMLNRTNGTQGRSSGKNSTTNQRTGMGSQGTTMNANDEIAAPVKAQISSKVRQMAPQIRNVYVSANPDFASRMMGYADQFRAGHPVRGLVNEFNLMVERIFPNNAAGMGNMNGTSGTNMRGTTTR